MMKMKLTPNRVIILLAITLFILPFAYAHKGDDTDIHPPFKRFSNFNEVDSVMYLRYEQILEVDSLK